jgi:hypothetical protein
MVWIFLPLWKIMLLKKQIYPEKIHTEETNPPVNYRNGAR